MTSASSPGLPTGRKSTSVNEVAAVIESLNLKVARLQREIQVLTNASSEREIGDTRSRLTPADRRSELLDTTQRENRSQSMLESEDCCSHKLIRRQSEKACYDNFGEVTGFRDKNSSKPKVLRKKISRGTQYDESIDPIKYQVCVKCYQAQSNAKSHPEIKTETSKSEKSESPTATPAKQSAPRADRDPIGRNGDTPGARDTKRPDKTSEAASRSKQGMLGSRSDQNAGDLGDERKERSREKKKVDATKEKEKVKSLKPDSEKTKKSDASKMKNSEKEEKEKCAMGEKQCSKESSKTSLPTKANKWKKWINKSEKKKEVARKNGASKEKTKKKNSSSAEENEKNKDASVMGLFTGIEKVKRKDASEKVEINADKAKKDGKLEKNQSSGDGSRDKKTSKKSSAMSLASGKEKIKNFMNIGSKSSSDKQYREVRTKLVDCAAELNQLVEKLSELFKKKNAEIEKYKMNHKQ